MIAIRVKTNTEAVRRVARQYPMEIQMALVRGFRRGAELVVKQAMLNLTSGGNINMGNLRASMGYKMDEERLRAVIGPGLAAKSTANQTGDPRNYGYFVEHGRSPGGMPPPRVLELWVQRKLGISNPDEIERVAYLVGRKMAAEGTEAHPFLAPAARAKAPAVAKRIQKELDKTVEDLNRRGDNQAGGRAK